MDLRKDFDKTVTLTIPFLREETALMVHDVLNVDKEFKGSKVKKNITINSNSLSVSFYSTDLKILRVAVNGFLNNVILIVKTIKQFEKS